MAGNCHPQKGWIAFTLEKGEGSHIGGSDFWFLGEKVLMVLATRCWILGALMSRDSTPVRMAYVVRWSDSAGDLDEQ